MHLTPLAVDGAVALAAVPEDCFRPASARHRAGLANYDREALLVERWAETTLCGRVWAEMIGGDGGSISPYDEKPAFAPTCKRCLSLLDRMFPPPPLHPQLPLVARLVADLVAEHGYAEIYDVPGDQQTELRRQIRSLVRKDNGHPCQTLVHGNLLMVVCEPITELHREEQLAAAVEAMNAYCSGEAAAARPEPEWRLSWSTWTVD